MMKRNREIKEREKKEKQNRMMKYRQIKDEKRTKLEITDGKMVGYVTHVIDRKR